MCGARWQALQTLLGRASASPALSGWIGRIGCARILLPLAPHTSSILNTINLQKILYNRIVLMGERCTVWWEDISEDAASLFRVWTEGRELHWAKKSWEALGKRGLTSYADEVERARVVVRLMTLAAIYRDFCELVGGLGSGVTCPAARLAHIEPLSNALEQFSALFVHLEAAPLDLCSTPLRDSSYI